MTTLTRSGAEPGHAAPKRDPLDWNLVVTAQEGAQRELVRELAPLVRLRRTPFRNVRIGKVEDVPEFLAALMEQRERQPFLDNYLARVLPVERTFRVDPAHFPEDLQREMTTLLDRVAGHSFHVRVERRGHKGAIHTHQTEQALGEWLFDTLAGRGKEPVVEFRDPALVVAVELVGEVGGIGLVSRELRERFPFVRL